MAKIEEPEQRRRVKAVNISKKKGEKKKQVENIKLIEDFGIEGDAHGGTERQVSLLAAESIKKMEEKGLKVGPGAFAENIVTEGIDLRSLPIGAKLEIGNGVELAITQIGKVCHDRCAIYHQVGECVMPKEGVFAKVLTGGVIRSGDEIGVIE